MTANPRPAPSTLALTLLLAAGLVGCGKQKTPERRYYDEHIQPVFNGFCVGNTSPCHRIDRETGVALGNLDLSSFEAVQKRRDVLRNYGAYPQPLLLLKALPEESVLIPYDGKLLTSEIRHVGLKTLSPASEAYFELKRWIDQGATRDGLGLPLPPQPGMGGCAPAVPEGTATPAVDRSSAAYQSFAREVGPMLQSSCAYSNCHSSPQADFFLTCGETEGQLDANFARAASFIARVPRPARAERAAAAAALAAGGRSQPHRRGVLPGPGG